MPKPTTNNLEGPWEERLRQVVYNQEMKPEYRVLFQHRLEQLIMDVRKHDEDALVRIFAKAWSEKGIRLIKEYYNK